MIPGFDENGLRRFFGHHSSTEASPMGLMLERLDQFGHDSDGARLPTRNSVDSCGHEHRAGVSRVRAELDGLGIAHEDWEWESDDGKPLTWEEMVELEDPTITADIIAEQHGSAVDYTELDIIGTGAVRRALEEIGEEHSNVLRIYYGPTGDGCVRLVPYGRLAALMQVSGWATGVLDDRAKRFADSGEEDAIADAPERLADEYLLESAAAAEGNRDQWREWLLSSAETEAMASLAAARVAYAARCRS